MIPLHRGAFGALFLAVSLVTIAAPSVQAQDAPAPVAATDVQTRTFKLRNLKPSLVAFWLDPAHHAAPVDIQLGQAFILGNDLIPDNAPQPMPAGAMQPGVPFKIPKLPRLPGNANGPRDLKLPAGIESIKSVDPQNSLVVRGTTDGLKALETLLPAIDVPIVQHEVEASFYELDRATLPETGLKFQPPGEENDLYFGSATAMPVDFEKRIENLVASKRATLLSQPRVTLLDGLGAQLKQSINIPVVWNETLSLLHPVDALVNGQTPQRIAFIQNSVALTAAIARVEGGLIAVGIEPRLGTRILSVRTTIREDQPFAIQLSPSTDKRQIIIIVTPRRVRRMADGA